MTATVEGIDISYAQPNVDWRKIAANVGFAVIKATEGRDFIDNSFTKARVDAAVKALGEGFVGYYHFARSDTPSVQDARNECRDFVRTVRDRGGRLGRNGVLDYERAAVSHHGNDTAWISAFVDEYRKLTGERPWIYGGSVLRDQGVNSTFNCPLWLAAYVSDPQPYIPGPWKASKTFRMRMWQFTEAGSCDGVPGHVDKNRFYGTKTELKKALV